MKSDSEISANEKNRICNCVCRHPASDHTPNGCDCGCLNFEYDDGTDGPRPLMY